jgi:hypothetical protein
MTLAAFAYLSLGIIGILFIVRSGKPQTIRRPDAHYENYTIDPDGTIVYHKKIDITV